MAMARRILAQNEALEMIIPRDRLAVAGVQHLGGAGTVVLEGTVDEVTWSTIQVRSAADETVLATSVNAAGIFHADVSYCSRVRLRKTDAGSTANPVALSLNHN